MGSGRFTEIGGLLRADFGLCGRERARHAGEEARHGPAAIAAQERSAARHADDL